MNKYQLYCKLIGRERKAKHIADSAGMDYVEWVNRAHRAYSREAGWTRGGPTFEQWLRKHGVRFIEE